MGRLHARILAGGVRSAELAGIVDEDFAAAHAVAGSVGSRAFATLEQAVKRTGADGVVIAAPTGAHTDLVGRAARLGKPVLCEKPLGGNPAEARAAVAAAAAAQIELRVAFQRRFDPGWLGFRDMVADGELGEIHLFRCSHRNAQQPQNLGSLGDLFVDVAVHDLDCALWLAGPVGGVSAYATDLCAAITLQFQSGAIGLIDVHRAAGYGFECAAEIIGDRATCRLGEGHRMHGVEVLAEGRRTSRLPRDHAERHASAYERELHSFGLLVAGKDEGDGGAVGADAVAALELACVARASAAAGRPAEVHA